MYLNINSECKYTHIYLINNTSCNFFAPVRLWHGFGRGRRCRQSRRKDMHRILIVSDEEFLRDVIRLSLADMQADVRCASDVPDMRAWSGACCSTWSSSWGLRLSSRAATWCARAPRRSRTAAGLRRGVAAGRTDGVEPLGVRRRPVHDLSREPSAIADEDRQRLEPTVMTETLLMLYTMFAAAGRSPCCRRSARSNSAPGGAAAATPLCARNTCVS